MKILIVEDDRDTAELIRSWLESNGNIAEVAENGADGSFMARSFDYDAVILDYSLPKKDGLAVCREIRAAHRTSPILFLSITGDTDTKVAALEAGADDYMTKPFALKELNARLQAIARRPAVAVKKTVLTVHDLTLDTERHTALRGDTRLRMTRKEFGVLEYLMRHSGTVISRALLMEHVWTAESNPFSNTVEAHVRNLRKKLNAGAKPDLILNLPGRGYIIDSPENLAKQY